MIMMINIDSFAWNSVFCNLMHKYIFFEDREERQQTKDGAGEGGSAEQMVSELLPEALHTQ